MREGERLRLRDEETGGEKERGGKKRKAINKRGKAGRAKGKKQRKGKEKKITHTIFPLSPHKSRDYLISMHKIEIRLQEISLFSLAMPIFIVVD